MPDEERVAERLVDSRVFDTQICERSTNGVDELLAALEDKRLEVSLHAAAKAQASLQYIHQPGGGSGNSSPSVTNLGDANGGKPKDKGPATNKGKSDSKPEKLKPRPHPKAEVERKTKGGRGEPPGRFLQT